MSRSRSFVSAGSKKQQVIDVVRSGFPAADLVSAWMPIVERLEERRFFAVDTVQTLPFALDFNSNVGNDVLDKDGQGTGFTRVQANSLGTQYDATKLDLDTAAGVLRVTTSGSSATGSNHDGANSLVNALETQFNATTSGFKITARLLGPLSNINKPPQQAGIFFGPDQDNFVKLVAISQTVNGVTGTYIQFLDEQKSGTGWTHALGFNTLAAVNFASVSTLDLQLVGDATTGKIQAFYSVNGAAFVKMSKELTLSGTTKTAFFTAAGRAGILAMHKNDTAITATYDSFRIESGTVTTARPSVTRVRVGGVTLPSSTAVPRDSFIAADLMLPTAGAGVDTSTLTSATVKLYRTSDHAPVSAVLNTSGGGDAIVLTPISALEAGVNYTFEVTDGLRDTSGAAFLPYSATFTTSTAELETDPTLAFQKVALPTATGHTYTGVTFGPDGRLYASTIDGLIQRFNVNADGTLSTPTNITSLQTKEGGATLLIGMAFAPGYNPANPASLTLWVTHSQFTDVEAPVANDFTGKISKLTGANLATVTTMVVNLPRSVRDHMTNQLVFGPDGALYFNQGANTAMGAPDNAWGLREEHLLNAAILRLDTSKLPTNGTALDVKTIDVPGGTYNPFNQNNALTIYATGVRNSYDLVWTTAGRLFAPSNGSAAGGSTPGTPAGSYSFGANQRIDYATNGAYTGPNVIALTNLQQTQNDYLFNVVAGGYYGNPNPSRGEFVLNGGNPTSAADGVTEVPAYPSGTLPDRNYRGKNTGTTSGTMGSAYSFGKNYSPNGIIEYSGDAFGGSLRGKLLVAEYSGGDDIVILTPDANGNIISAKRGIAGLTHFTDPLDIIEDPNTGFLYVAEYGGQRLTLVKPIAPGANVEIDKSQMVFNDITAAGASAVQKIKITNTGTSALAIPPDGLSIIGAEAARFAFVNKPAAPYAELAPGESLELQITFTAGATAGVIHAATLQIKTNDPDASIIAIPLRGIAMSSLAGGANEPSLQKIFDLYRIPVRTGDPNPATTDLEFPLGANDEVLVQSLQKAGSGPVTIESLAVFGVGSSTIPTFRFGYYTAGSPKDATELLKVTGNAVSNVSNSQTVNPNVVGQTSFDPGSSSFGLYTWWQNFTATGSPTIFSEDSLNRGYDVDTPHKVRFYQYRTPDGTVVPDAFIFTFEEYNGATDQQDYVGIIRNVKIAPGGAEIGLENQDGVPFQDRMIFNRIEDPTNTSPKLNNIVHDTAKLTIRNTGTSALNISSLSIHPDWQIIGGPSGSFSIAAGSSIDLTVKFVYSQPALPASPGVLRQGTLVINSNDADEPVTTIDLAGWWQPVNEGNREPLLPQQIAMLGYKTVITYPGQVLNQKGKVARVGDEVLSPYWLRADGTLPVEVRQISAHHSQELAAAATVKWHVKGSTTTTNIFKHDPEEGQSMLPHIDNAVLGSVSSSVARGIFSPTGTFGFRVDNEWSDPTKNPQEQTGGGWGHHVRFFVVKDRDGRIVPNAYLMVMDYSGINYDYQDNVYLITNIKPESAPSAPTGLTATGGNNGIALNWADNTEANLAGYNVYRSTSATGTFAKLNGELLSASEFVDVTAPSGQAMFYIVKAVDNAGNESGNNAPVSGTRGSDTVAPATPTGFTASGSPSGIQLDWANNTDADLGGYHLFYSTSAAGPWTQLGGLLTTSDYFDATAPTGATRYYQVKAVDTSGNDSGAASASATRPAPDTTEPAAPSGVVVNAQSSGITLDWANNTEGDLAGYNVYRATSASGPWTKLNASVLTSSIYTDTTATIGQVSYYQITAVDTSSNESDPASASGTRPAPQPGSYTHLEIGNPTPAGSLTTITEGSAYDMVAGGADIWGTTDSFGFLYRQVSGDFDYRVRVAGLTNSNAWAKAGLMARESLVGNSRNVFALISVANGHKLTARGTTGGTTSLAGTGAATFPNNWLRLARVGNVFTAYRSTDGATWTSVGSVTLALPQTVFFGLATTSHNTAATTTAQYRDLSVNGSQPVDEEPAAPTGVGTTASTSGIVLNWNDNTEADLAGYNVYRATSASGPWTKLNTSGLLTSSQYNDTTAPSGVVSYYRISAVDDAAQESAFALASATRPNPTLPTGPFKINFQVVGSPAVTGYIQDNGNVFGDRGSGLQYGWSVNHTDQARDRNKTTDQLLDTLVQMRAGSNWSIAIANGTYNVKVSVGDPQYTTTNSIVVNGVTYWTHQALAAGAFTNKTMQVTVTNGRLTVSNAASSDSTTRINYIEITPAPVVVAPIKINYQLAGSPAVAGYLQDNGAAFGTRNGYNYGWNGTYSDDARDRNRNADQLLDTLMHMRTGAQWSIDLANGTYSVKLSIGDSQYASVHNVTANGVSVFSNVSLGINVFQQKTVTVNVTNGKLTLATSGTDRATRINYIEIQKI